MKNTPKSLWRLGLTIGACALAVPLSAGRAQDTTTAQRDTMRDQAAAQRDTTRDQAAVDTMAQDSAHWGHQAEQDPAVQNPPGYRGMERDTTMFPPQDDTAAAADPTTRIEQRARQDTLEGGEGQNPPGYRGMERPAELDTSAVQRSDTAAAEGDTTAAKKSTTKEKDKTTKKRDRTAADTTAVQQGDTTRTQQGDTTRAQQGDTTQSNR